MLKITDKLSLPVDAVTQTFGILAMRGAGKTNAARVMAEEMFRAKLPFVAVDPVGSWWGLRSGRDGASVGLPIPIFGGKRGDVPLERTGGSLVADLIADERLSCVLDLTTFESEGAKKAFLLDFARRLYLKNEAPLHLFLEEADDYIPQRPMRDEAQLLRAWENIVRRGRARGLGVTLITQRSAAINKNVLTQVETLVALRTTSPQDRAVIEDWLKYHAQARDVAGTLASLANGEAWVWSPQWLGKTERVRFRLSETFDSGETPKMAKGSRAPATLADVDLSALSKRMADTIERAKADDPKALRAEIAQLKKQLSAKAAPPAPTVERVEVPVISDKMLRDLREQVDRVRAEGDRLNGTFVGIVAALDRVSRRAEPREPAPTHSARREDPLPKPTNGGDTSIGAGELRILAAIAQHKNGVTREQLTVLTGYKRSSRDTYLQRLRAAGYVEQNAGRLFATSHATISIGPFEALPTGRKLLAYWLDRLAPGEKSILESLAKAYPESLRRNDISDLTEYKRSSRDTYIQRLRARELVEITGRDELRASPNLMEE